MVKWSNLPKHLNLYQGVKVINQLKYTRTQKICSR